MTTVWVKSNAAHFNMRLRFLLLGWQPFSQLLWLDCADFVKAVAQLLGEMKMLLAAQCKVVMQDSSAAHIAGNQGPHTTVPLSASPLPQEDSAHCKCHVHGDYYSQGTHHYHPLCVLQSNPCRSFTHTRSAELDDSECLYS